MNFVVSKCFEMNFTGDAIPGLLIFMDRLCFDRHKFYSTSQGPLVPLKTVFPVCVRCWARCVQSCNFGRRSHSLSETVIHTTTPLRMPKDA